MRYFINIFQFALITSFLAIAPAFGQVTVIHVTAYNGMTTTTTITSEGLATLVLTENRDSTGHCAITYAEGDIPPQKIKAMEAVEGVCRKYNRSQSVAAELAKEFNTTHYQALKVALEGAFGWGERYQRAPVDGLELELKKIARKYLRAKKKAQKERMKRRLIRDALKSRR